MSLHDRVFLEAKQAPLPRGKLVRVGQPSAWETISDALNKEFGAQKPKKKPAPAPRRERKPAPAPRPVPVVTPKIHGEKSLTQPGGRDDRNLARSAHEKLRGQTASSRSGGFQPKAQVPERLRRKRLLIQKPRP